MSSIPSTGSARPLGHEALADRLVAWLLRHALASFFHTGTLRVTAAGGQTFTVGDGNGKPLGIRFASESAQLGTLLDSDLKVGEAYMNGSLVIEEGTLAELLALVLSQTRTAEPTRWAKPQWVARYLWRRLEQFNSRIRAHRNVARHYDLDGRLYSLFLDSDRQYSCAYFESAGETLDDAQLGTIVRLPPQRCPHCRKWLRNERRRE